MVAALRALTGLLLVLAAVLATSAAAQPAGPDGRQVAVQIHQFSTLDVGLRLDRILAGDYDAQFLSAGAGTVRLRGGNYTHWLRFTAELPEAGGDWILSIGRAPLDRIALYLPQPGGVPQENLRRFFQPAEAEGLMFGDFAFVLPRTDQRAVTVYAAVSSRAPVWLSAGLLPAQAFHREQRSAASLAAAVYAALLVLALGSLSLWVALHDRAYLYFVGFTASLLLLLAMDNGHAYALPGVSVLAWWGPLGIAAVSFLCCAMALGLVQRFVALRSFAARADQVATVARWALLALVVLCLANVQ